MESTNSLKLQVVEHKTWELALAMTMLGKEVIIAMLQLLITKF
jgi:hypothetical protein